MFKIEKAYARKTIGLKVEGWRYLNIEYGFYKISHQTYFLWNVIGVNHTFNIPMNIIIENHGDNYIEHFEKTLITLKQDLLNDEDEFNSLEYRQELKKFLE